MTIRGFLDRLYGFSALGGGLSFILIFTLVILQLMFRILDGLALLAGFNPPGVIIPSLAEIGTALLVSGAFLSLGYAFHKGAHIRVNLLRERLPANAHLLLDRAVHLIAIALTAFATMHVILLASDSFQEGLTTSGLVAIPLFLPQAFMGLGLLILFIAILDALICGGGGGHD